MTNVLAIIRTAAVLLLLLTIVIAPATEAVTHAPSLAQAQSDHDHAHDDVAETAHQHGYAHHDGAEHDHSSVVILPSLASLPLQNTAGHVTAHYRQMAGLGTDGPRRPPRQQV